MRKRYPRRLRQRQTQRANRQPARRVIYRSRGARSARLAVGMVLAGATAWLAVPVLASEQASPPPTGLWVGFNTESSAGLPPARSKLLLDVRASGCANPATVEGLVERPASSWHLDERLLPGPKPRGPTQAEAALAGAKLESGTIGLAPGQEPGFFPNVGIFGIPLITGEAEVFVGDRSIRMHDKVSSLLTVKSTDATAAVIGAVPASGVALTAPEWPATRASLHFILKADLVKPDGFQRCYLDIPELFRSGIDITGSAFQEAEVFGENFEMNQPPMQFRGSTPAGIPLADEIGSAGVEATVAGHIVVTSSIGSGGSAIPTGVHYSCKAPGSNLPQSPDESCLGSPVFEVPGTAADVTRRLFAAGIVGALAATLIVESLFLGETEPRKARS
jgi:hypothetical protein